MTTPKGEYLAATSVKAGRGAAEVIAAELPKELAGIYWAKNMYWRRGEAGAVCAAGAVDGGDAGRRWWCRWSSAGMRRGSVTYGHRVLFGDAPIALKSPGEYEEALLDAICDCGCGGAAADDSQGAGQGDADG